MTLTALLPFTGALLCSGLAAMALFRDPRSFVHWVFAAGMIALGVESALSGLSIHAAAYAEVVHWQRLRFVAAAFVPGCWLLFSLSFARINYQEFLAQWRWIILAAFACPLITVLSCFHSLLVDVLIRDATSRWVLGLSWGGYLFSLLSLLGAALILMNLERTLRASTGSMRWQIKFVILGLGSLFAIRIYTGSQTLLFSTVNSTLETINAGVLIVANVLIFWAFVRSRLLNVNVYLSQTALYYSLTVLVVGLYLLAVGMLAKAVSYVGGDQLLPFEALLVFLAFLALAVFLVSDEWRQRSRRFISHHFQRPQYDYRREWTELTQRTSSLLDRGALCDAVVKRVSETFGVACVTLWLLNETQDHFVFGGSTVFTEEQARGLKIAEKKMESLVGAVRDNQMLVAFDETKGDWAGEFTRSHTDELREARIRYCVPLVAGRELLGILTLDERSTRQSFSVEDADLLKTIADQAAANLLNLQLSQRLVKAKEMEAFQTLSTFFVHDLKNLASTLSLTLENLPIHFADPEFRTDTLRVITNSVNKINTMCSRLSLLTKGLELQAKRVDLNALVATTIADLNGALQAALIQDLHPLPPVHLDPEQIQKVLMNLVLNANEATGPQGEIHVKTGQKNGWAVLAVRDNGSGMSPEFIERSLFQPFQTTKSKGLGIGLFHSKKIVEAHQGRIEVESMLGKGSEFRVLLPLSQ
jgi:putative PEP-CTERM system histidine kinase